MCISHSQNNGYQISWKHKVDLYNKLTDMASKSKGITLNTKLKREHIELTSYSRMHVDLAAQIVHYIQLYMITKYYSSLTQQYLYICIYMLINCTYESKLMLNEDSIGVCNATHAFTTFM